MTQVKPTPDDFDLSTVDWHSADHPSGDDHRVEVAFAGENVLMRSGTSPEVVLVFTQAEWDAFVAGALDGEFDY